MFQVQMPYSSPLLGGLTQGVNLGRTLAMMPAQIRQANALAAINQYKASNPEFMIPAGSVGQAVGLHLIGQKYGVNSPEYLTAQKMIMAKTLQQEANAGYKAGGGAAPMVAKMQFYSDYMKKHPNATAQDALNAMAAQNINALMGSASSQPSASTQSAQSPTGISGLSPMPSLSSMINKGFPSGQPSSLSGLMGQQPAATQQTMPPQQSMPAQNQASITQQRTPANADGLDNIQSALIHSTVPTQIGQQRYYATTAGALYNQGNQFINSVAKYAGGGGTFQKIVQTLQASGGTNNPDYQNLMAFQQTMNMLANEARKMLGGQATDSEMNMLKNVATGAIWRQTPKQVLATWKNFGDIINNTGKVLKKSPAQIEAGLGNEANVSATGQNSAPASQNKASVIAQEIARRQKAGVWK